MASDELRIDIAYRCPRPDGSLARMLPPLLPHLGSRGAALSTQEGLSLLVPVPADAAGAQAALSQLAPLTRQVASVASALGVSEVSSYVLSDDSDLTVSDLRAVDAAVLADLAASVLSWRALAGAFLPLAGEATSMRLLLARQSFLGTMLAGYHLEAGGFLDVDSLAALAENGTRAGEWQLMATAAATAVLANGYSSVFEQGERLEPALVLSAGTAVNSALLEAHAELLGHSAAWLAAMMSQMGAAQALSAAAR